jgi:hypothetical protein
VRRGDAAPALALAAHTLAGNTAGYSAEQMLSLRRFDCAENARIDALLDFARLLVTTSVTLPAKAIEAVHGAGYNDREIVEAIADSAQARGACDDLSGHEAHPCAGRRPRASSSTGRAHWQRAHSITRTRLCSDAFGDEMDAVAIVSIRCFAPRERLFGCRFAAAT